MYKKFFLLLILILSFCGNPMSTPEKTLRNYFNKLISDKIFDVKYWDLNEFCKIYYGKIWEKASDSDKKEQISIIEKIASKMVQSHKDVFAKVIIKDIKKIEEAKEIAKYKVIFVIEGFEVGTDSYTDFVLKKFGNEWKIINYEKIKYGEKEVETSLLFTTNFSLLMQNLGFKNSDEIELKMINEFMKNSFNLK